MNLQKNQVSKSKYKLPIPSFFGLRLTLTNPSNKVSNKNSIIMEDINKNDLTKFGNKNIFAPYLVVWEEVAAYREVCFEDGRNILNSETLEENTIQNGIVEEEIEELNLKISAKTEEFENFDSQIVNKEGRSEELSTELLELRQELKYDILSICSEEDENIKRQKEQTDKEIKQTEDDKKIRDLKADLNEDIKDIEKLKENRLKRKINLFAYSLLSSARGLVSLEDCPGPKDLTAKLLSLTYQLIKLNSDLEGKMNELRGKKIKDENSLSKLKETVKRQITKAKSLELSEGSIQSSGTNKSFNLFPDEDT